MAISVTTQALGEFAEMGYYLRENGDHIVELLFKDSHVDYFGQVGVTPESLQNSCRRDWNQRMEAEAY